MREGERNKAVCVCVCVCVCVRERERERKLFGHFSKQKCIVVSVHPVPTDQLSMAELSGFSRFNLYIFTVSSSFFKPKPSSKLERWAL